MQWTMLLQENNPWQSSVVWVDVKQICVFLMKYKQWFLTIYSYILFMGMPAREVSSSLFFIREVKKFAFFPLMKLKKQENSVCLVIRKSNNLSAKSSVLKTLPLWNTYRLLQNRLDTTLARFKINKYILKNSSHNILVGLVSHYNPAYSPWLKRFLVLDQHVLVASLNQFACLKTGSLIVKSQRSFLRFVSSSKMGISNFPVILLHFFYFNWHM